MIFPSMHRSIFCSARPGLFGDLCMTYGDPQYGLQSNSLPIGVALSYDESTLLSCDVHQNAELVRLFDIQTGQLKHTITSHEVRREPRTSPLNRTVPSVDDENASSKCCNEHSK